MLDQYSSIDLLGVSIRGVMQRCYRPIILQIPQSLFHETIAPFDIRLTGVGLFPKTKRELPPKVASELAQPQLTPRCSSKYSSPRHVARSRPFLVLLAMESKNSLGLPILTLGTSGLFKASAEIRSS